MGRLLPSILLRQRKGSYGFGRIDKQRRHLNNPRHWP
jgi:hypothetical protein